ncbi:MAG: winged helix-turn-helix transcriptional regulator [Cyanobacteriota bacterium]
MVANVNPQKKQNAKNFSETSTDLISMFEDCIGCKWTLHILMQIRNGVNRPGALVKTKNGLTTKVLNERLTKMIQFRILEKLSYPEVPPRVEYHLTSFGQEFVEILDRIEALRSTRSETSCEGNR